ncbi:MAG: hypothetical protein ACT4PZ_05485 [Panacagrimonas sp.]
MNKRLTISLPTSLLAAALAGAMPMAAYAERGNLLDGRTLLNNGLLFEGNLFSGALLEGDGPLAFDGERLFDGDGLAIFDGETLTLRDGDTEFFSGSLDEFVQERASLAGDRLNEQGAEIDRRFDDAANQARENGRDRMASLLDQTGDTLQEAYERRSDRIQDRADRRADRIERARDR